MGRCPPERGLSIANVPIDKPVRPCLQKKARWWNRLGGKPVGHAASPRFGSRETRHYCKITNPYLSWKNNPVKPKAPFSLETLCSSNHYTDTVFYSLLSENASRKSLFFCFFCLVTP